MPAVIKSGDVAAIRAKVAPIGLIDHLAEARTALEEARAQAKDILARAEQQAREESHRVFAQARELGYKAGYKRGLEEGAVAGREAAHRECTERFERENAITVQHMGRAVDAIDQVVTQLEAMRGEIRREAEEHVLDFALRLAARITRALGATDSIAAGENLKRCLALVHARTDLTVRVNPQDLEFIRQFAPTVVQRAGESTVLDMVGDESISPGGCIVETPRGRVDATLETQIEELSALMAEAERRDA